MIQINARRLQAKDLPDWIAIAAIQLTQGMHGVSTWSTLADVQALIFQFPPKVVKAKLRSMIKRGLIGGCACGCRGDFELR